MYELFILSRLMRMPSNGYRIAKIINDVIGPYAKISNGRFYPLLAKMEQDGLIVQQAVSAEDQHGDRQSRQFVITAEGRRRYHQLMMDTTSNPGEYQKIFMQKVFTFELLQPEERKYLIDHYINYCQAHILHQRAEREDLMQRGLEYGLKSSELASITDGQLHLRHQWELELDWARQLYQKYCANIKCDE